MLFIYCQGENTVRDVPFYRATGFTCSACIVRAGDAKRMWGTSKKDPATFEGMLAQWVNRFEGNRVGGTDFDSTNFSSEAPISKF